MLGRLIAEGAKSVAISAVIVGLALAFGIDIASGVIGVLLLIALSSLWGIVYSGYIQLIALKARNSAAVTPAG